MQRKLTIGTILSIISVFTFLFFGTTKTIHAEETVTFTAVNIEHWDYDSDHGWIYLAPDVHVYPK